MSKSKVFFFEKPDPENNNNNNNNNNNPKKLKTYRSALGTKTEASSSF